jgi:hypothetical protein
MDWDRIEGHWKQLKGDAPQPILTYDLGAVKLNAIYVPRCGTTTSSPCSLLFQYCAGEVGSRRFGSCVSSAGGRGRLAGPHQLAQRLPRDPGIESGCARSLLHVVMTDSRSVDPWR